MWREKWSVRGIQGILRVLDGAMSIFPEMRDKEGRVAMGRWSAAQFGAVTFEDLWDPEWS